MQTLEQHILPLVRREALRINGVQPTTAQLIDNLVGEFSVRFQGIQLNTFDDSIELCSRVEEMLSEHPISEELTTEIKKSRRIIFDELLRHGMEHGSLSGNSSLRPQQIWTPGGTTRGREQNRTPREYRDIIERQNFDIIRLATWLGVDAAADVLCALGQIGMDERSRVTSFISAYLGECSQPLPIDLPRLLTYPPLVLEVPSVRSVANRMLLQDVYETLMEQGADDFGSHQYVRVRQNAASIALQRMQQIATEAKITDSSIHAGLFVETSSFFQRACNQNHPQNLVTSLQEQGRDCPFPSLRQLIAVQLLKERRKLYVGFEPGKGKTPIPFHLFEQLRDEGKNPRMLYLGPPSVIQELPNRIRPGSAPQPTRDCYYEDPNNAPTVGIVSSNLDNTELINVIGSSNVTFVPYSMLHSRRDFNGGNNNESEQEMRLIHLLTAQNWDILVIDEAHNIDGNGEWTHLVDQLLHGENGLGTRITREGYVIALSGTPVMNTIADPVMIHDVFLSPTDRRRRYREDVRDTQGRNTQVERGLNPIRVRQALNETLLVLDKPEKWLDNVDMLDYGLSDRELQFITAICSNPTLHAKEKIDACMQFILCPRLVSGDDSMPESLWDWVSMQLDHDLREKNSILIAESMRAQGVLRERDNANDEDRIEHHFFEKIRAFCSEWSQRHNIEVRFHTVHGDIDLDDRQIAYADAATAKNDGSIKNVIFAWSGCLNTGIRLALDRIISLEWPYNSPDLQQLLKRALREGDTDVRLTACYATGTVQQGVYEQAMDKFRDGMEGVYGAGVTDEHLRSHIREHEKDDLGADSEAELMRVLKRASPSQQRYEIERWLHGRGTNGVFQFWDRHRDLFTKSYEESDNLGTGDMQRFIAALVAGIIDRNGQSGFSIVDIGSSGLTLERELRRSGHNDKAVVLSTDIHASIIERGRTVLFRDNPTIPVSSGMIANPGELLRLARNGNIPGAPFDIAVLRNLEQCNHMQTAGTLHERARALLGAIRTVQTGGRIIIPISRTSCTNEEFQFFTQHTLPLFGCIAIDGWNGPVRSEDNADDTPFRGFCVVAEKYEDIDEQALRSQLRAEDLSFTHHARWTDSAEKTRIKTDMRSSRLPYPLRHSVFKLGNRTFTGSNILTEARSSQETHLQILTNSVQIIRGMASTAKEWNTLPVSEKIKIANAGIVYSPELSITVKRPTFYLREYPGHLFFPFDQQWKGIEE